MSKMKEVAIGEMNGQMFSVSMLGTFRFGDENEMGAFRGRLLEFLERERKIYILEPNIDVSIVTKEYKENYGNQVEILKNRTVVRI